MNEMERVGHGGGEEAREREKRAKGQGRDGGGERRRARDEGMARARGSARSGNWLSVLPSPTNHPTTPRDWYRL